MERREVPYFEFVWSELQLLLILGHDDLGISPHRTFFHS